MKRILVVDDDKDLLVTLKALLKQQGYDVIVCATCDDGLSILSSFRPDIIFLDINVGNEDGGEMCKQIKAMAEYSQIPIIVTSAHHSNLLSYHEYGADAYLNKPFSAAELLDILDSHKQGIW